MSSMEVGWGQTLESLACPVTSSCLGGLGSDRPVRVRPSLQVLLDSALSMRRPRPPRWPATWEPLPRPHRRVRDGSLRLHTTRADAISGSGAGREGRTGPRLRSCPSKIVGWLYAHQTLWLDPGPDWDEEKVAEFLEMCASTWCARHRGERDPGGRAARRPSS